MTKKFGILLLPCENKNKKCGHYWTSEFIVSKSGFTRTPLFFMSFSFFKTILIQLPNPTYFFVDLTGFFRFIQSMYTAMFDNLSYYLRIREKEIL